MNTGVSYFFFKNKSPCITMMIFKCHDSGHYFPEVLGCVKTTAPLHKMKTFDYHKQHIPTEIIAQLVKCSTLKAYKLYIFLIK